MRNRALALLTNLFPLRVLLGGALALVHPAWSTWFSGEFITWGLAVIMLGMGITLSLEDRRRVLRMPRAVGIGFSLGYFFSRLLRCDELTSRTISVEVGTQNSGLGAALARAHFTTLPLAALPCALSATFHSIIGSILAGIWRLCPAVLRRPTLD